MGLVKRYIKPVCVVVAPILKAYFIWLKRYSNHPEKCSFETRYKKLSALCKKVSKGLNVDYYFEGFDKLDPNEVYCFIGNHLSFFDALTVLSAIDNKMSVVAKKEVEGYPFVYTAVKMLEGILIPRDDLRGTLKLMKTVEEDMVNRNKSWMIFPEGTRTKDERLVPQKFHSGTFRTPTRAKVTIVPVCIWGSDRVLQTNPVYKRYPVYASALKPITYDEYKNMTTEEIACLCHERIVKEQFVLRRKDHEQMLKDNKNYKIS